MITEEMLKGAAKEAGDAIIDSLPAQTDISHVFSKEFDDKMEMLMKKIKYKKRKHIFHQAACWTAVLIVAASSFLMFNTEAGASLISWIKGQYCGFMEYRYTGDGSSEQKDYVITYMPEGFYEKEQERTSGMNIFIYENGEGSQLSFISSSGADAISVFVTSQNFKEVLVGDQPADYYEAEADGENSVLVWYSEDRETIFNISAALPEEELVKIAESVELE